VSIGAQTVGSVVGVAALEGDTLIAAIMRLIKMARITEIDAHLIMRFFRAEVEFSVCAT
jgi:hypothetical protein